MRRAVWWAPRARDVWEVASGMRDAATTPAGSVGEPHVIGVESIYIHGPSCLYRYRSFEKVDVHVACLLNLVGASNAERSPGPARSRGACLRWRRSLLSACVMSDLSCGCLCALSLSFYVINIRKMCAQRGRTILSMRVDCAMIYGGKRELRKLSNAIDHTTIS